jgi:hypothetical protein
VLAALLVRGLLGLVGLLGRRGFLRRLLDDRAARGCAGIGIRRARGSTARVSDLRTPGSAAGITDLRTTGSAAGISDLCTAGSAARVSDLRTPGSAAWVDPMRRRRASRTTGWIGGLRVRLSREKRGGDRAGRERLLQQMSLDVVVEAGSGALLLRHAVASLVAICTPDGLDL